MKYHVGQRVRIVLTDSVELYYLIGTECVIKGTGPFLAEDFSWCQYLLSVRGTRASVVCNDDHIEPIIDDGRTVVEWASMPIDPREVVPA